MKALDDKFRTAFISESIDHQDKKYSKHDHMHQFIRCKKVEDRRDGWEYFSRQRVKQNKKKSPQDRPPAISQELFQIRSFTVTDQAPIWAL